MFCLSFQVLAEREKRLGSDSVNSSTDELNTKNKHNAAQHLLEEIRQAVSEANAKGINLCFYKDFVYI